jgi:hypothetical protein
MNDFVLPVTRYALSHDVNIAYQTLGDGPIDLIIVPGIVSHTDFCTNSQDIRLSCVAFRNLLALSPLISEVRVCPTEYLAPHRLSSGWMTFAL